jgi:hypothetical protein
MHSAIATRNGNVNLTPDHVQQVSIKPQIMMDEPPAFETKDLAGNI